MFAALLLAPCLFALASQAPAVRPTLAVLPLSAKTGISPGIADVVTDQLVDTLRRANAFSRVVSSRDVETALGMEQARQMMSCGEGSCLAEIAGAFGVDLVVVGSVARLGDSYVLSLRMMEARTGVATSSVTRKLDGKTEEVLFDAVAPSVEQMLSEAKLDHVAVTAPVATPAQSSAPVVAEGRPRIGWLAVAGGAGALSLLLAASAAAGAVATYVVVGFVLWRTRGDTIVADAGGIAAGAGVAALVGLAALVLVSVAGTAVYQGMRP